MFETYSKEIRAAQAGTADKIAQSIINHSYQTLEEGIRILETAAVCAASNCGDQSRTAAAFSAGASLAPLRESKTQLSNSFRVEDAKIVLNIRRNSFLVAAENLFVSIVQSYIFEHISKLSPSM